MSKFLSTESIDRTLPDEFEKEDWKEYLRAKYREEAMKIIEKIDAKNTHHPIENDNLD